MNQLKDNHAFYKNNQNYSVFLDRQEIVDFRKYTDWIKKLAPNAGSFLDVGCGTGKALSLLPSSGISVKGVDVSNTSIQVCKQKGLDCQAYDGQKLPFAENTFDIVGSINVLEHVNNPEGFLNEQLRVLKQGGYLVVVCPNFLALSNSYHEHTAGLYRKFLNFFTIISLSVAGNRKIAKMKTIVRDVFRPDDDACNVTNPIQIIAWAKVNGLKKIYWSAQSIYKLGITNYLDFYPCKLFLGSNFIVFEKRK